MGTRTRIEARIVAAALLCALPGCAAGGGRSAERDSALARGEAVDGVSADRRLDSVWGDAVFRRIRHFTPPIDALRSASRAAQRAGSTGPVDPTQQAETDQQADASEQADAPTRADSSAAGSESAEGAPSAGPPPDEPAETGFAVETLAEGEGPEATAASRVVVRLEGRIANGAVFQRFDEPVGPWAVDRLIPGLARAVEGMAVGERRRVTIPPGLGYGERAVLDDATGQTVIPPGSTLIYEVELVGIEPEGKATPGASTDPTGTGAGESGPSEEATR